MVRNFTIWNTLPFRPERAPRKKTGPAESPLITRPSRRNHGARRTSPTSATHRSRRRRAMASSRRRNVGATPTAIEVAGDCDEASIMAYSRLKAPSARVRSIGNLCGKELIPRWPLQPHPGGTPASAFGHGDLSTAQRTETAPPGNRRRNSGAGWRRPQEESGHSGLRAGR